MRVSAECLGLSLLSSSPSFTPTPLNNAFFASLVTSTPLAMTYTPLFSPPGGHQLNLPSNQVIADRKASTVAMPNGLNIGGRNVIQKYMPNLAGAQPAMYSTPPMPQQAYAFPPPPPHAARAFFPSPEPTIDGAHAPTRHLPIGVQDASGAMQAGLGLSFEGGAPISQEELDEAAACHGGRYPDRSQLSPEALGHVVHRILPPIVNTGNQGQMKPQMGDWVCGQCRFTVRFSPLLYA